MKRTLAGQAADTYVLASAEKIGAVSPYLVLNLDAITAIITDAHPDTTALQALQETAPAVITTE
jgi:DeoR/GlpR family transcriptional regulator of sugar metabolism